MVAHLKGRQLPSGQLNWLWNNLFAGLRPYLVDRGQSEIRARRNQPLSRHEISSLTGWQFWNMESAVVIIINFFKCGTTRNVWSNLPSKRGKKYKLHFDVRKISLAITGGFISPSVIRGVWIYIYCYKLWKTTILKSWSDYFSQGLFFFDAVWQ